MLGVGGDQRSGVGAFSLLAHLILALLAAWLYEMYLSTAMRFRMQLITWLTNWRLAEKECAGLAASLEGAERPSTLPCDGNHCG